MPIFIKKKFMIRNVIRDVSRDANFSLYISFCIKIAAHLHNFP